MPRITHLYYSARREQLRKIWASGGWEFSLLTAREQWDLHEYYVITQDMTDAELRLHRRLVGRVDPSLPQRAGRAFAKLQRRGSWQAGSITVTKRGAITVRSVVKPKPDLKRYARALLQLAMEQHGLTPTWTWSEMDALLAKSGGDSRVGDIKSTAEPRE